MRAGVWAVMLRSGLCGCANKTVSGVDRCAGNVVLYVGVEHMEVLAQDLAILGAK